MRLVVWNARRGRFEKKCQYIEHLQPDIAVLPEVAMPETRSRQLLWFGDDPKQGMAVIAKEPYKLTVLPAISDAPKYIIPIAVEGPIEFTLLAVWTLGRKPLPYVEAASAAIDLYQHIFAYGPVVMMGDFNSNAKWDKKHPSSLNHSSMVARLLKYGLVSAYHWTRGVEHGAEQGPDHTFYLYGHEDKPYHIDYCFLPETWAENIESVTIGSYADWKQHSDHRPLQVTLRDSNPDDHSRDAIDNGAGPPI